jgi:transcriptional regulator with XRE-family HTH domain
MDAKIGFRLKLVRKTLGVTQLQFASVAGIPRSTYTKYELGRNIPKVVYLNCICDRYNINQDWLIGGMGSMFNQDDMDAMTVSALFKLAPVDARAEILEAVRKMAIRRWAN